MEHSLLDSSLDDVYHPILKRMRYSAEHKQETRERIVRTAGRHFRQRGSDGVGIADLMGKLKLTHGGFYKHFESKEELLAEAVLQAFAETQAAFMEVIKKAKPGTELRMIVEHYLSVDHCENLSGGCPVAALVSEMPRYPRKLRLRLNQAMRNRTRMLAGFLPGKTEKEREQNCLVLLSGMIGAVNLARATEDSDRRRAILEAARDFYVKAFCN